jgi:hypothetical protein
MMTLYVGNCEDYCDFFSTPTPKIGKPKGLLHEELTSRLTPIFLLISRPAPFQGTEQKELDANEPVTCAGANRKTA